MTYALARDDSPVRNDGRFEFDGPQRRLVSFFTNLKMIHRWTPEPLPAGQAASDADAPRNEPRNESGGEVDPVGRWADLFAILPAVPAGHFRDLAAGMVPHEQVRHIEAILSKLRRVKTDAVNGFDVTELGPQALELVRSLAVSLGTHRFYTGEDFVLALLMRQAAPPETVGGLELIQVLDTSEQIDAEWPPRIPMVSSERLVYLLPYDPDRVDFADRWSTAWVDHRRRIETAFVERFRGWHAVVELRDRDGVTMSRGECVGPSADEVVAAAGRSRSSALSATPSAAPH